MWAKVRYCKQFVQVAFIEIKPFFIYLIKPKSNKSLLLIYVIRTINCSCNNLRTNPMTSSCHIFRFCNWMITILSISFKIACSIGTFTMKEISFKLCSSKRKKFKNIALSTYTFFLMYVVVYKGSLYIKM